MKKILFFVYGVSLLGFTFFSYLFIDPNLNYYKDIYSGFAFQNREITTLIYFSFVLLFFILYLTSIRLFISKKINILDIKKLIILICLTLFFSYPAVLSYDIFNYTTTAKVLFFYQENPYIIMPIEFIGDSFLSFTHAANKIALYGPIWLLITGLPYLLGVGNFFFTLLIFKIINIIFYILTASIIWKFKKNPYPVILFALNPLVIIETLVSNHNDIVMMFFALLSFYLLHKKKIFFAICVLILSIGIKFATIFLVPIFIYTLWRSLKSKEINWNKTFFYSFLSMLTIFLLSPIREEMYPWYASWFLVFGFLIDNKKYIKYFLIAISFGLLLRYIPFMHSGTHFGQTPTLRIVLTLIPVLVSVLIYTFQQNFKKYGKNSKIIG